jgi:hypothetical protein
MSSEGKVRSALFECGAFPIHYFSQPLETQCFAAVLMRHRGGANSGKICSAGERCSGRERNLLIWQGAAVRFGRLALSLASQQE